MITRAERLELFAISAREKDCLVCRDTPRAERAQLRAELWVVPIKGTCLRCINAFVKNITGCEPPTKH